MDEEKKTVISITISRFDTLQKLNLISEEYNKTWDELINLAIERFLNDIQMVRNLRISKKLYED